MPNTDLPTLQQRVERALCYASMRVRTAGPLSDRSPYADWTGESVTRILTRMHDDFANDDETEIAHAASAWLRKVNR
jgi:hypothetical protein